LDLELEKISKERLRQIAPEVDQREELEEDELELLKIVEEYPFIQNTKRAYHLGWHRSRFSKVRKSLLEKGFLEEISFKTKERGAPSHFLKLKGKEDYGKGGFIHAYWVEQICNHLRKHGYAAIKEFKADGKMVDIAFEKDEKLAFVEVEYKSDWEGNILRGVKLCDRLISVFVRKSEYMKAKLFLGEKRLEKVAIVHVHSYQGALSEIA